MAINSAVLDNVYNYYHSDIAPKTSSRFDSHNKKDLKAVYKSIINISKDEPVFLMDRSKELENYTISMKESAHKFRNDVASFGSTDASLLFSGKMAFSSDPDTAELTRSKLPADDTEDIGTYSLEIKQLATGQENTGKFLDKQDSGLRPGNYSFDIATKATAYELQFVISQGDTNYDIQRRMAKLINNFNLGLSAEVMENDSGESALSIRSNTLGSHAGEGGTFNISDEETSQNSGIVDYFGIRNTTAEGHDAIYSVNGEEFSSPINEITVGDRFNVTLKKPSAPDAPVAIGIKPDYESVRDSIMSITDSYNEFINKAAGYIDVQPRTNLFVSDMKMSSMFYISKLDKLGISQNEDGTLSVDEEKLSEAVKEDGAPDELEAFKDFTRFALRKAEDLQLNPMDYVDKRIVAYKNPQTEHFATPYITSAYSGMLFNSYM